VLGMGPRINEKGLLPFLIYTPVRPDEIIPPKPSPFGAPDYIPTTDSPHDTPVLERLGKYIGRRVTPYHFGSGTFF